MTQVIVTHASAREGIVEVSVNGQVIWFRTHQLIDVDPSHLEAMDHAGISYTVAGGGGGGSYTAQAVNVAGPDVSLRCASLAATDNGRLFYVLWFKRPDYPASTEVLAVGDPDNDYFFDSDLAVVGDVLADCNAASEAEPGAFVDRSTGSYSFDEWHSLIVSLDTNLPVGEKIYTVYLDDQHAPRVADDVYPNDAGDAFVMPFNGRELYMFDDGFSDGTTGDFADYRFDVGRALHDADGTIPEATRRLFVTADNKPVDPAVATAALGTPTCLFTGNAAAFVTNQGNGGAFTLSGTLTDATTSPST